MFYFSAFDESWKVDADVGAYWGLWDQNEQLKLQRRMLGDTVESKYVDYPSFLA